jgi:hypothetical protein
MELYQPVLFVGLGGTGGSIGLEFERRLRQELLQEFNLPFALPAKTFESPARRKPSKRTRAVHDAPTFEGWTPNHRSGYALISNTDAPCHAHGDRLAVPDIDLLVAPLRSDRQETEPLSTALREVFFLGPPDGRARLSPWDFTGGLSDQVNVAGMPAFVVALNLAELPWLGRYIDGIRAALWLMLVLVLAAFASRPDPPCLTLVLVATSRRYGYRSEPDDHALPAYQPISVGGEFVLHQ